ncbi:MAG: xanthine and dehydrogenase maturation factor XdhC/CoxF family-like protein [Segetibacter sp.]|nr:xanthine and dehydrogenase maturation factor XdhC/CoxF family-like protein [Segetibacter sp.]
MMKKQLQVWQLISKSLGDNIPVMLLYVVESLGSSPGRAGFFMAINAKGEMHGSIGGGIMEHKFVEMAKETLKNDHEHEIFYKQIHDKTSSKFQSGMICSGEQSNVLYKVKATDGNTVNEIINCIQTNRTGKLILSKERILFDEEVPEQDFHFHCEDDRLDDWVYEEQIGYKNNLHIIGSGHCALALSELMSAMDFYIHLYDDRGNLKTFLDNKYAHQKTIVNDYLELKTLIPSDDNNYVVVMTVGYRTDDIVVRSLMDKDFKFFGLLGSKKKIEKMFSDYRKEGINEGLLKKIHAPVGLPINSQTPEEIAVSIAAQIIRAKNEVL